MEIDTTAARKQQQQKEPVSEDTATTVAREVGNQVSTPLAGKNNTIRMHDIAVDNQATAVSEKGREQPELYGSVEKLSGILYTSSEGDNVKSSRRGDRVELKGMA